MPLSRNRQIGESSSAGESLPEEKDLKIYEVFTQKKRGDRHIYAGSLHAPDVGSAVELAREHYGQDEACANLWVVAREHIASTGYEGSPINKAIEHSYRYARDYQDIREKWQHFRDLESIKEYEKEDLKEAF